ncbi:hypothetical protein CLV98_103171 [Dyadobacter jejuensis]|uniref:TspO/MBR related protein n=1 Tax=Dyadobacter jejuensis TaxID=1082580 RepID=A0A316ANT8_9BACT|nr:hypothetical protein [Dyadobacter jejuensis]PWJ58804.1 hypothetical protein CLV98_103171 [Dyadobacter jejuensis]
MTKTLQISNIVALIATILINYLSNTGIFNGETMASVSAAYQNYFTPSGYAFSIWGLIYLLLIAFVIYQSKGLFGKGEAPSIVVEIGWLFVFTCVANSGWVVAWLYGYTGLSVVIMMSLLGSLLAILLKTRMELELLSFKRVALEWWPFAIYAGWIVAASIANMAAWLTKIGWEGFGLAPLQWTVIMIVLAGLIYLFLIWNRNLRESALVGVWALVAIGHANWGSVPVVAYSALLIAGIIFLNIAAHALQNRGKHYLK